MSIDWRKAAFEEFAERRKVKQAEIAEARANAQRYQTILKARESELIELERAATILGIVSEHAVAPKTESVSSEDLQSAGFKDLAIEYLKNNYPNPVRAIEIQNFVERKLMRKFHEKTAGMTLFRLSKSTIARRSGWDWYYVPEDERPLLAHAEQSEFGDITEDDMAD